MNVEVIIQSRDKTTVAKSEIKDGYINPYDFSARDMEIVLEGIIQNIPDFHMQSKSVKLLGGLMNYEWRIQEERGSI